MPRRKNNAALLFSFFFAFALGASGAGCGCDDSLFGDSSSPTGSNVNSTPPSLAPGDDEVSGDPMCVEDPEVTEWPVSGYMVRFKDEDSAEFHAWVSSPGGATRIATWLDGTRSPATFGIPRGPLEADGTWNPGYSFQFVPDEIAFTTEAEDWCDETACFVEDGVELWDDPSPIWCPWSALVIGIWDCNEGEDPCPQVYPEPGL
ncbi:hypothetical protein K8I61_13990 [bacterium]|nr:hypothetical protein [bacterium]